MYRPAVSACISIKSLTTAHNTAIMLFCYVIGSGSNPQIEFDRAKKKTEKLSSFCLFTYYTAVFPSYSDTIPMQMSIIWMRDLKAQNYSIQTLFRWSFVFDRISRCNSS